MAFKVIQPNQMEENVFDKIKLGMPLLTAESGGKANTMTVNWGQMGYLWNKCVTTIYLRPQRFTLPILEGADGYSLCFMGQKYATEVMFCGRNSGKDVDKIAHCGFTLAHKDGIPYFEEAEMVLLCKKSFGSWMTEENFIDRELVSANYPEKDFHRMFIGEIKEVLVKE